MCTSPEEDYSIPPPLTMVYTPIKFDFMPTNTEVKILNKDWFLSIVLDSIKL